MSSLMNNPAYSRHLIFKGLLTMGVMLLLCKFTMSVAYALFYPMIVIAFVRKKSDFALLWVLAMAVFLCTNSYFVPKTAVYGYLQRAGIMLFGLVMGMSLISRGLDRAIRPLSGILVYVIYMLIPSAMGWSIVVSYLKIILYMITMFAWLGMMNVIIREYKGSQAKLRSAFLCYAIFLLLGSFILLGFPAIGQMGLEDFTAAEIAAHVGQLSLFKGMTQHAQALGPLAAMTLVVVLGDYIFGVRKNDWLYNTLLLCGLVVLLKTSSRTAFGTFLVGVGVVFLTLTKSHAMKARWRSKVLTSFMLVGIVCLAAILVFPQARQKVMKYVVKYNAEDAQVMKQTTLDDITGSRKGALEKPLANWRKSPMLGNGFQVSEEMSWIRVTDIKSLLTAPVEKGTWVVAVLEEGGVVGMLILCLWIFIALIALNKRKCYIGRAALITLLVSNLGEFSMFSLSYIGSTEWVLVMTGIALDYARNYNRDLNFSAYRPVPSGYPARLGY